MLLICIHFNKYLIILISIMHKNNIHPKIKPSGNKIIFKLCVGGCYIIMLKHSRYTNIYRTFSNVRVYNYCFKLMNYFIVLEPNDYGLYE